MAIPWRAIAALAFAGQSRGARKLPSGLAQLETEGGLPCSFEVSFDTRPYDPQGDPNDLVDAINFYAFCTEKVTNCKFKRPYIYDASKDVTVPFRSAFRPGLNPMPSIPLEEGKYTFVGKTFTFYATKADGEEGELSVTIPSKAEWEAAMRTKLEGKTLPQMPGQLTYGPVEITGQGPGYKILLSLTEEVTGLELFVPPSLKPKVKGKSVPPDGGNYRFTLLAKDEVKEGRVVLIGRQGLQEVVKVLELPAKDLEQTAADTQDVKRDEEQRTPQQPSDNKATDEEPSDAKCVLIREKDSDDESGKLSIEVSMKCDVDVTGVTIQLGGSQYVPLNDRVFKANKKEDLIYLHKEGMKGKELWFEGTANGKAVHSNKMKIEEGPQEWIEPVEPEKKKVEEGDAKCTIRRDEEDTRADAFTIYYGCNTDVTDCKVLLTGNQYVSLEGVAGADTEYRIALAKDDEPITLHFEGKVKDGDTVLKSNELTIEKEG